MFKCKTIKKKDAKTSFSMPHFHNFLFMLRILRCKCLYDSKYKHFIFFNTFDISFGKLNEKLYEIESKNRRNTLYNHEICSLKILMKILEGWSMHCSFSLWQMIELKIIQLKEEFMNRFPRWSFFWYSIKKIISRWKICCLFTIFSLYHLYIHIKHIHSEHQCGIIIHIPYNWNVRARQLWYEHLFEIDRWKCWYCNIFEFPLRKIWILHKQCTDQAWRDSFRTIQIHKKNDEVLEFLEEK